ncbi:MAG: hypothetical protein AAF518_13285 [Spirochaetota bacterium]
MKQKNYAKICLLLSLLGSFGYCSLSPQKKFPKKQYYIIEPKYSSSKKSDTKISSIRVVKFRISKLYENKGFVYKKSDVSFDSDFYNEFLISPSQLITERVEDWLLRTGLIGQTASRTRFVEAEYILEGYIHSLYGDFSDKKNPQAVLGIDFYLIDNNNMGVKFSTKLTHKEKLKKAIATELVKGWNRCFSKILLQLTEQLKKSELKPKQE